MSLLMHNDLSFCGSKIDLLEKHVQIKSYANVKADGIDHLVCTMA